MSDLINLNPILSYSHNPVKTERANQLESERTVRAVQYLNRTEFSPENRSASRLSFGYDDASKRQVVKVIDRVTGGVLYQMPAEQVLKMAADIRRRAIAGPCSSENSCDEGPTG